MHEAWTDRLSDYVDGALGEADRHAMLEHLEQCAECRLVEAQIRRVIAAAQDARSARPAEPTRDLWPGIAAGIAAAATRSNDSPTRSNDSLPTAAGRSASPTPRRFSFSMPQLAAAALLLVTVSSATVWFLRDTGGGVTEQGTIVQGAGAPSSVIRSVSTEPESRHMNDIAELEVTLDQHRDQLDPATVDIIERSLEAIDDAIADARSAIDADPGNPYLHRQLDNTLRRKADILRRVTRVQRAGS